MSDKVIAVMDKPNTCENCVFGVCKYSTPLSTRVKGYTCQLKPVEDRIVDCFSYDGEVHLENCPLISAEEHDKEIRDKAIEEFIEAEDYLMKKIKEETAEVNIDFEWRKAVCLDDIRTKLHEGLSEIAEQMKEVGE